jgi:hypothetical protein
MTVVILIVLVCALFFGTRYVLIRQTSVTVANAVGIEIAIVFLLGVLVARLVFAGPERSAQPLAQAPVPTTEQTTAPHVHGGHEVTPACRPASAALREGAPGNLDTIVPDAGGATIANGGVISASAAYWVEGWAADAGPGRPAIAACLVVDGRLVSGARADYAVARPDVAAANHRSELVATGYEVEIAPRLLTPGSHRIRIAAKLPDGSFKTVPGFRDVTVR